MNERRSLRVLHADHSTARGGAEYALIRMLSAPHPWSATVAVPGDGTSPGVWSQVARSNAAVMEFVGRRHTAGASKGGGLARVRQFAAQVLDQAFRLRTSHAFRVADVVHANTSRAGLYCTIACLGANKPVVIHLRDLVDRQNLGGLGYILTTRFVLPRADGVIANSQASLRSARPFLKPAAHVEVIHSAFGSSGEASQSSIASEIQTVGMVARIDTWKGQDLLLRAFARAFPSDSTRLVLAGSADFGHDTYLEDLQSLAAQLGIASRVDFLGHVTDIQSLISSWDLCVQSSIRPEPLGQNVLQYLAAGRPAIVTDQGGPSEWVRDGWNGWTFAMGSVDALTDALTTARDPHLRQQVAANAALTPNLLTDRQVAEAHGDVFEAVHRAPTRRTER